MATKTKKKVGRPRGAASIKVIEGDKGEAATATNKGVKASVRAREYAKAHPQATTQEIADALGTSYNNVYQALKAKKVGTNGKPGRKPARPMAKRTHVSNGTLSAVEAIKLARTFADAVGGMEEAQELLTVLCGGSDGPTPF